MILKGEKVVLRPVRMSDAPRFVKWFNDKSINKFLLIRHLTLVEERKYIKQRLKSPSKDKLHFCIDTKQGRHIGACGVDDIQKRNRRAEIGIVIGDKAFWNQGLGTDTMSTLINFAFDKLKLHRLSLDVYNYNPRAIKLYKKLGFKKEGVAREGNFWNGKFWNYYRMGLLDREWKRKQY